MSILKFDDGVKFDTSGKYRIESRHDGLYVVGGGLLIPVNDQAHGESILADLKSVKEDKNG